MAIYWPGKNPNFNNFSSSDLEILRQTINYRWYTSWWQIKIFKDTNLNLIENFVKCTENNLLIFSTIFTLLLQSIVKKITFLQSFNLNLYFETYFQLDSESSQNEIVYCNQHCWLWLVLNVSYAYLL